MSGYKAPIQDMAFVMNELGILNTLTNLSGYENVSAELVASILDAAGKFASNKLAPLNQNGDRQGCSLKDGVVQTPDGFSST